MSTGEFYWSSEWKWKKSKNVGKYLDLAREQKNQWNVKVTARLIVAALGMVPQLPRRETGRKWRSKGELRLSRSQITSTRILRRVLETRGDLQSLIFQGKKNKNKKNTSFHCCEKLWKSCLYRDDSKGPTSTNTTRELVIGVQ